MVALTAVGLKMGSAGWIIIKWLMFSFLGFSLLLLACIAFFSYVSGLARDRRDYDQGSPID
jgi:hypothetical protein